MKKLVAVAVVVVLGTGALAACGGDDGANTRDTGSGSASGSGSGAGSGSGSGSGISESQAKITSDDPRIEAAIEAYRAWAITQAQATLAATEELNAAIAAGNLEQAKALYAPSRQGWESIEPLAGLVEEIDGIVDSRVDDFANEDDPEFTGWHRIEYLLFAKGDTAAALPYSEQLVTDLGTLVTQLETIAIPPAVLAVGAADLVEEVSTGKITGEEDRYSGTDLWDFAANIAGSQKLIELLTPILSESDPQLLSDIQANFAELDAQLAVYSDGNGGFKPYSTLTPADKTKMTATLGQLSENLSLVPGALGLEG